MISFIITTKNNEKTLERLLQSIKKQTYKNWEIVVVDNNSTDNTKEIAKKYTKKVFNKGPERSVQRNFGVTKARGEYVAILDSDMVLSRNVASEIGAEFNDPRIGGLVIPEKSIGSGYWARVRAFERVFYEGDRGIEAARAFRGKIFKQFGGYDENITGPEDADLPLRMRKAGVKIGRIKSYIFHDEQDINPIKSARKKYYYARGAYRYLKRHPEMALSQGNLIFRPAFFRKPFKLIKSPYLTMGLFVLKLFEMGGALLGIAQAIFSRVGKKKPAL